MKEATIIVAEELTLIGRGVSENLINEIKKDLIINNPKYTNNRIFGFSNWGVDRYLTYIHYNKKRDIIMPRGYLARLKRILTKRRVRIDLHDKTTYNRIKIGKLRFVGELRDSQIDPCEDVLEKQIGVLSAPTAAGKTVMAIYTICEREQSTLILVHTKILLNQWRKRLVEFTNIPKHHIGMIGGGHGIIGKKITIAIINSMSKHVKDLAPHIGYVIVDECFVKGTLVDGNPIEQIKIGDFVNSFNHKTNKIERKRVVNTFKSKPKLLSIVKAVGKLPIIGTASHPYYTQRNYLTSLELNVKRDTVLSIIDPLYRREYEKQREKNKNEMLSLRNKHGVCGRESVEIVLRKIQRGKTMLFRRMHKGFSKNREQEKWGQTSGVQQETQKEYLQKNEKKQPYASRWYNRKDENNKESKWYTTYLEWEAWWQWALHSCTKIIGYCFRLGDGSSNIFEEKRKRVSNKLQSGYRERETKDSSGDRWSTAQCKNQKIVGSKERAKTYWTGLESVEIQKSTSNGEFGGLCEGGYVYNIEVEDNHNYFVNDILVHNCHRTPAKSFVDAIKQLRPQYLLGLSATPYRRDKLDALIHFYLGDIVHEITIKDLQDKGEVMVPSLSHLISTFTYYAEEGEHHEELYRAMIRHKPRNEMIVSTVEKCVKKERGVVLVISERVQHCETLHYMLKLKGVKSILVQSGFGKKEQEAVMRKIDKGGCEVVVSTSKLIGEGSDIPALAFIFLTMPIRWKGKIIQNIGRILRTKKGKHSAEIWDIYDEQKTLIGSLRDRVATYNKLGADVTEIRKLLRGMVT